MDTVVVTGATGGLGQALCTSFADQGHHVFASTRDADAIESITESGSEDSPSISGIITDVRDEYDIERFVEVAAREGDGIDVLIPCAAVHHGDPGTTMLADESYAAFDDTIRTNLRGVFATIREAVPHLDSTSRVLVPVCPAGETLTSGDGSYAVSKAGVHAVAEIFAAELDAGVAIVNPGVLATDLTDEQGRDPQSVTDLFLAAANQDAAALNDSVIDHRSFRDR